MKATQQLLHGSRPWSPGLALLLGGLLLALAPARLAAIPAGALSDPRYGLGYLVVTYYPGVTNDGSGDCTAGIQAAIADAFSANHACVYNLKRGLAVFFPPGTYTISDTLQCYQWWATNGALGGFHMVVGSTAGASRPLIRLAAHAPNFTNAAAPRPMIAYNCWVQNSGGPNPPVAVSNPMKAPNGFYDGAGGDMVASLRNIDFDCNSNAGAVGVVMSGAQACNLENVKVSATNAFGGFYEIPGAGGYVANVEIAGGRYGILQGNFSSLGLDLRGPTAGPMAVGLTMENQTVAAIWEYDMDSPMTIIGFKITNSKNVLVYNYQWNTSCGVLTMLDGQIGINSATNLVAFDNSAGKDLYLRNIYITGTTNLVKSGANMTTGSGAWSYLAEYSYNNQTKQNNVPPNNNYSNGATVMNSYSVINGKVQDWTVLFPVSPNIVPNSAAPPTNLVSRHLWASFPSYNGGDPTNDPPTVVVSTNAGWNNTNGADSTVLLQAAIDQAWTNTIYHGRVFIPAGKYYTTNMLTLHTNTVLIGAGLGSTCIQASGNWMPTNNVTMVKTEDSASATTTLAYLHVASRSIGSNSETNYSWFNEVTWQAGANSLVLEVSWNPPWTSIFPSQPRAEILFTNNGGGHWYGMVGPDGQIGEQNPADRLIKIAGTTQPLWLYSFNLEHGHGDMDCEVTGASNVRMVGMKREGDRPLLVMTNCTNIAAYGFGFGTGDSIGNGFFQVLGASTNILLANLTTSAGGPGTDNMLYEALTGQPVTNILWPNAVSLYKRGEINDAAMFVASNSSPSAGLVLTAAPDATYPSLQIDLAWNSVSNATGYSLQRSTTNGGPYAVVANTPSAVTNYNDTGVFPGTTYYYVVAATNVSGPFTNSAQATAATQPNAAPTLNPISGLSLITNAPQQNVTLSGLSPGANESSQTLTVTASSSNTGLIPTPTVNYTNPNPTGTLTFTPAANASGSATITVTVRDNGGTNGGGVDAVTQAFLVTVSSGVAPVGNIFSNTVPCSVDINSNLWLNGGSVCSAPAFGSAGIPNNYIMPATNLLFTTNSATAPNLVRAYATNTTSPYYTMYFHGDSLSLGSNWLLKLKSALTGAQPYTAYTFTNSIAPASPGLILNGGMIEDGETSGTAQTNWLFGVMAAAKGTLSYLSLSGNEFWQAGNSHNFYMAATVAGTGNIMISGGTNGNSSYFNGVIFTNAAPASTFSGVWIIEGGHMCAAPNAVAGAYGSNCSFVVDNLYPTPVPWGTNNPATSAQLDLSIPITSTGTLIVTNSGKLWFTFTCAFSAITIAGSNLPPGSYTYSTLTTSYPGAANNIVGGSTGTLIVGSTLLPVPSVHITPGAGGNYTISYSGGAGSRFVLLTATSVNAPLSAWTPVQTNTALSGSFIIPTSAAAAAFYRVQSE